MRPMVARICEIASPTKEEAQTLRELGPFAAAPGFHFIIDRETEEVFRPAFDHLYERHGQDGLRSPDKPDEEPSVLSNRAAAYELVEWLRFCKHIGRDWKRADHQLLSLYAHLLATNPSYHTGRRREPSTIAHKLGSIYAFYRHTNATGLTSVTWDAGAIRSRFKKKGRGRNRREACDVQIRPFDAEQTRKLLEHLGPPPSKAPAGSLASCRDRLLFEVGLLTGMRGEEICFLRADAIKKLTADLDRPDETKPLQIKVTKGRVFRWIALPNELIHELKLYIKGERAASMAEYTRGKRKDHGRLFVNPPGRRRAGAPLTTNTIHKRTRQIMIGLGTGFAKQDERVRGGVKEKYVRTLHSFHDTRHTYAIRLYLAQRAGGDSEPWRTVQAMLGHASWTTTERYYYTSAGTFEPQIGVRLRRWWEPR